MERFLWLWSCWRSNKRFVIQIYVILITIQINIFEKKQNSKKKNNSWSRCSRCCTINYWWWIGWLGWISGSSRLWDLYCVWFSWRANVFVGEQCCASVDTRCGSSRTTVVGTRRHRRQRCIAAHDLVALQSLCFVQLHVFNVLNCMSIGASTWYQCWCRASWLVWCAVDDTGRDGVWGRWRARFALAGRRRLRSVVCWHFACDWHDCVVSRDVCALQSNGVFSFAWLEWWVIWFWFREFSNSTHTFTQKPNKYKPK